MNLLSLATKSSHYKRIAQIYRELYTNQAPQSVYLYWQVNRILTLLENADHHAVENITQKLIQQKHFIAYYYLAQSLALRGLDEEAIHSLKLLFQHHPQHLDATYLYADLQTQLGNKAQAIHILEHAAQTSKRKKTWQALSNLVDTKTEFDHFYTQFKQKYPIALGSLSYDLACHLSNAALRAKKIDFALDLWRAQYHAHLSSADNNAVKFQPSKKYTDQLAARALSDIRQHLDESNIPFFLISGTLLGCIREHKLLAHDKDIDIGVWETHTVGELHAILRKSGCFYILPNNNKQLLVIRHVNGTTIDIFIHYREANDYWHAGGKSKWHNTPFELVYQDFLGSQYLIPKNYDLYLTENYGNWHTPKPIFDSALDTPNMEITSHEEMLIYLYKKLTFTQNLSPSLKQRLQTHLISFGEKI